MALPTEINISRIQGDGYPLTFNSPEDLTTEIVVLTVSFDLNTSPAVLITADKITFDGAVIAALGIGRHHYKVYISSSGGRTAIWGTIQIYPDNIEDEYGQID